MPHHEAYDTIPKLDFDRIHTVAGIDFLGEDFAIFKDLPGTDFAMHPIRLAPTVFSLVLSGSASIRVNMRDHTFVANQLVTFVSQHIIEQLHTSPDFSALFLVVSPDFIRECIPQQEMLVPMILHLLDTPALSLTPEEAKRMHDYYDLLRARTRLEHPFRKNILRNIISTVFYDVTGILQSHRHSSNGNTRPSHKQEIFTEFLRLVGLHCRKQRSVMFYAELMGYTAKYLSTTVKTFTNRTALEWIEEYAIIEAKTLLRSTNMSIQQVTSEMNFPTQSFFGKYFKHYTGMSPGQYRREN